MYPSTSSSNSALFGLGISDVSFGSQTFPSANTLSDVTMTGTDRDRDLNTQEAFRHNMQLVHQQILRIQGLSRSALDEM